MQTNRCGNIHRENCCAKGSGEETRIQEVMDRNETNVESETEDYIGNV
jgi:hypothetical protein